MMFDDETPEELTAQDIKALGDSVKVIDDSIASGQRDEETIDTIYRNVFHIELMLTEQNIVNSGEDLTVFEDAVARGREALGS